MRPGRAGRAFYSDGHEESMTEKILFAVGLSHLSTPVAVREGLAVKPGTLPAEAAALREACGLEEAVLVGTCSRFEVYAVAADADAPERVKDWLAARAGRPIDPFVYFYGGEAAARHLFRVAAGLDSWIVGETEILGQVKSAYQAAQAAKTAGRVMNILFQKAIGAGKAVRSTTRIAEGIRSVGGAAAILARKLFGENGARRVVVFGAGQMARTAAEHLIAKGVESLTVANRTYEKAVELAETLGGRAERFEAALERLDDADVAVFSTSSSGFIADAALVAAAARRRGGRSLFLIDVGVPRNVDPAAAAVPGVFLYDIDDLKRMVARDQESRKDAAAQADRMAGALAEDAWSRIERPVPAGGVS